MAKIKIEIKDNNDKKKNSEAKQEKMFRNVRMKSQGKGKRKEKISVKEAFFTRLSPFLE